MSSPTERWSEKLSRILTDEDISVELRGMLDAYMVLPTREDLDDHLTVLDRDAMEAMATLRSDLVSLAAHIRSTITASKVFMEAFERMMVEAEKIAGEGPGSGHGCPSPLVGSLIDNALGLYREMVGAGIVQGGDGQ